MRDTERAALERLNRLGGDDLARELVAAYLEQTADRIAAAQAALRDGDATRLANSAHSIRSSSAQLGAHELAGQCESLEGLAESGDLARGLGCLAKIEREFQAFGAWLVENTGHPGAAARERPDDARPAKRRVPAIAVVEDNADNRLLIDAILGDAYALDEYETGTEALAIMPMRPPALVLLDVSLPGLDGLEVLARIRRDAALRDVPVVAVTAHAMAGDRERYLAAGFDGYVPKPIVDERVLIDTVERLLPGRPASTDRDGRSADGRGADR